MAYETISCVRAFHIVFFGEACSIGIGGDGIWSSLSSIMLLRKFKYLLFCFCDFNNMAICGNGFCTNPCVFVFVVLGCLAACCWFCFFFLTSYVRNSELLWYEKLESSINKLIRFGIGMGRHIS